MKESFINLGERFKGKFLEPRYGVRYKGEIAEETKKFTRRGAIKAKQVEYKRLREAGSARVETA